MDEDASALESGTAESGPRAPASVLAPDSLFEGLFVLRGPTRIEGRIRGEVTGPGLLWVGEQGSVEGRVEVAEVVVAGRLDGEVAASRRVELRSSAHVRTEVCTPNLLLAEGSFLEGRCTTGGAGEPPPAASEFPGSP